jgi:hypothetical protein
MNLDGEKNVICVMLKQLKCSAIAHTDLSPFYNVFN